MLNVAIPFQPLHGGRNRPQPQGVNPMTAHHRRTPAEEPDPAVPVPDRAWRPRPVTPEELDDARTVLVVHRLDPRTGGCAACAADCPCPPALDAGRVLAEAGAWNTVPFTGPAGFPAAGQVPTSPRNHGVRARLTRLVRRLPWTTVG